MIKIIPSEQRFHADHGWLDTRHSFSFGDYVDYDNVEFGALRVLNDDIVHPNRGFGLHPHRDMEIITYVIEGMLEHRDSMGNHGVLRAGEVQAMTAGTGIMHSEANPSQTDRVHFLQIWITPQARNLTPTYDQKQFSLDAQRGRLLPVVSGQGLDGTLPIHQDATVYMSMLSAGQSVTHELPEGRKAHLFVIRGTVVLNGVHTMKPGDAARIEGEPSLTFSADDETQFMLIDLA